MTSRILKTLRNWFIAWLIIPLRDLRKNEVDKLEDNKIMFTWRRSLIRNESIIRQRDERTLIRRIWRKLSNKQGEGWIEAIDDTGAKVKSIVVCPNPEQCGATRCRLANCCGVAQRRRGESRCFHETYFSSLPLLRATSRDSLPYK